MTCVTALSGIPYYRHMPPAFGENSLMHVTSNASIRSFAVECCTAAGLYSAKELSLSLTLRELSCKSSFDDNKKPSCR